MEESSLGELVRSFFAGRNAIGEAEAMKLVQLVAMKQQQELIKSFQEAMKLAEIDLHRG